MCSGPLTNFTGTYESGAVPTGQTRAVVCYDLRLGVHVFGVDVDRIRFKMTLFPRLECKVWGCFSYDHKLDLVEVRQTLTGQRYIGNILQPVVYPEFEHNQAARPIFQDHNARPHWGPERDSETSMALQESRYESHRALLEPCCT